MPERLLTEWKQRVAHACALPDLGQKTSTETWAHLLIDAQRYPSSGREAFLEHVEVWLDCCREHAAFFQKQWRSLALLTRHLPQHGELLVSPIGCSAACAMLRKLKIPQPRRSTS